MVQMPVHPSVNWKSPYAWKDPFVPSWWDEDLARCFLQMNLKQGAVLRVKVETYDNFAVSLDGRLIQGAQNKEMIRDIIQPLRDEMQKKIIGDLGVYDNNAWYNSLPGVTKIKIYMKHVNFSSRSGWYIQYVTQHKMGRNGGKNYHITGIIKSLKKDGREENIK